MRSPLRAGVLFFLGALFAQSAWILAVPPYRMIDEFDHVYRADSVAHGFWATWRTPQDGRGDLIPVRRPIIVAGQEVCRSYLYPGPDNCRPVENRQDGLSTVASAASRYHPLYYWFVGVPSQISDGSGAVYVMRWVAALYCAVGIGFAAWCTARWARSVWPMAGLALALTPVLVYSTAVPAPNGIEMVAGIGVWSVILALWAGARVSMPLIAATAALGSILVTVRSLGTLWLLLIALSAAPLILNGRFLRSVWPKRRAWLACVVLIAAACVASVAWVLGAGTYELERERTLDMNPWTVALGQVPLWVAQSIAAFPIRDNAAPTVVYALTLLPFLAILLAAMARGDSRIRLVMGSCALLSLLAPYTFTVLTVETTSTIWQGRYTLPLSAGLALMAGLALDSHPPQHRLLLPLVRILALGVAAAHVISVVTVQLREQAGSPLAGDPRWWQIDVWWVGLLTLIGIACWLWVLEGWLRRPISTSSTAAANRRVAT